MWQHPAVLPRWTAPLPPPEMTNDIIIVIPTLDVHVGPKATAEPLAATLPEAGATTPAAKASKRQHGTGRHSSPAWPPPSGRSSSSSSLAKPGLARSQTSIVLSVSNHASATGARVGLSAWDTSDSPRASFRARAATSDSPRASFRASAHPARTSPKKQGSNSAVGKPSGVRRRSTGAKRDGGAEPQPSAAAAVDPHVRCAMLLDELMRHRAPRAPPPASIVPSAAWATLDISDGWVSFEQLLIQLNSAALHELVIGPPEQVRAPPCASDAPVYTEAMLRDVLATDAAEAAAAMSAERNVDRGSKQLPFRPYDTFVWVDVHRAMADGIVFWQGRIEGQLLCDGVEGDGVLPPEYISLVIECNGGLMLDWVMIHLLEQLFRHCARLELTLLHQCQSHAAIAPDTAAAVASTATATTAASAAALAPLFFVRAASFDAQGAPYEPVLAMLGEAGVLLSETERIRSLGITIGMDSAIKVVRGPLFAAVDGRRLDGSAATTAETLRRAGGRGSCGGAVLSVTNACWALPEYHTQLLERAQLLSSFQSMLKACSALQPPVPQHSRQHPSNSFNAGGHGAGGNRNANGQGGALGGRQGGLHGNSALASADPITSDNPAPGAGQHASGSRGRDGAGTPFPPATPEGLEAILRELWGAGGPLNNLAMAGPRRANVASTSTGGLLDVEAHRLAGLLAALFRPPPPPLSSISSAEPPEWPQMPEALRACLMQLASETGATGTCETDHRIRIRADGHVQCPAHLDVAASASSFAFVAEADEIGEIACSPFVELLQLLHRLRQPETMRLLTPAATPRGWSAAVSGQLQHAIYTDGAPAGITSSSPRQLLSPRNLRAANATPRQRPCTIGVGSGSGDSGISTQARGEKLSPRTDSNRSAHDSTGSRVPPSSSWLHGWRPLEVPQHGSLCSSAILADVRGMVWLLDFSAADLPATSPLLDAASLVCEMLLEWQPVPLELSELRGASAHELCEQFQLSEAAAVRLRLHLRECESIGALHAGCANDDELWGILPRIADEKGSLRRLQEATAVVDALLADSPATAEESKQPSTEDKSAHVRAEHGGMQVDASPAAARRRMANACGSNGPVNTTGGTSSTTPQLWKLGHRSPPAEWTAHAQHCFKLCITVLSLATELTAKSSQAEALAAELARGSSLPEPPPGTHCESSATCNPSDLHIANLLFPMLGGALRRLLLPTLGKWQKRLAWHMARSIAQMLHTALHTPPTIPPELGTVRRQEVRLAAGQRVAVLGDPESRLAGSEGSTKLCSVVAHVGEQEEGGGSVSLDRQLTRGGGIRASDPSAPPSMALPEAHPALTKPQTARPLFGDTSVEHRLTLDGLSHAVLPWHVPPADAIEAVLADTRISYGVLQELVSLVTMIPPADGAIADEAKGGGGMQRTPKRMIKGGNDESDDDDDERSDGRRGGKSGGKSGGESGGWTGPGTHAKIRETSDAICRELTRLQNASEPLRLPIVSLIERIRKAKADAADALTQANLAEGMATAAKEEEVAAIERAEQRRASAKVAEKQAAADEEKAVAARNERDVAEAKARELTAAVTKAAEMGAKLGAGAPKRGGGFNMAAMKADEAAKAAQAAREKVSAAQMAVEQTVLMAHAICEVATSAEQAAAKATAAKERALAHAAAAHTAASIGVIHAALIVAVTVDRRELERVVEAWAWQRLRQTGAAGVRAYAAGQRLMVRIDGRAGGVSTLKASEAGADVKATTAAAKKGERHVAAPPRTNAGCPDIVAGPGDTWVDATVMAAPEASRPMREHVVRTADGHELSLVLNPWNHGPLDLPTIRFDHVRARHARTMRVQHATLVDGLSGRRLDVLEQCVPIEIVMEEAGTTLFRDRQRAAAATTASTTAPASSSSAAPEAGSWASAAQATAGASEQAGKRGLWGLLHAATASGVRGVPSDYSDEVESVVDVTSLAAWLQAAHATRCRAANSRRPACVLLTAGPYEGKTCLLSQLVTGMIRDEQCALVPILVRSHELEAKLSQPRSRTLFAHSWNWVDAFLQSEYGAGTDIYRFLRQAMLARRALLLIDGLDEGGTARAAIERHIVDVLAPQGHTMVVTSRPAGLRVDLFAEHFVRLRLAPLSDSQQLEVIQRRVGGKLAVSGVAGSGGVAGGAASSAGAAAGSAVLERYLRDKVPIDLETGQRVSGNPWMLSVVLTIFQSRQPFSQAKRDGMAKRVGGGNVRADGGAEAAELIDAMPTTVTLYDLATRSVLEREGLIVARDCHVATMSGASGVSARGLGVSDGSATTAAATASCAEQVDGLQSSASETGNEAALAQLGALLQATFFEAHAMQRRVIDETVLDEAALGLVRPNVLHAIRADMAPFEGRAEPGHYVEVLAGPCVGKRGVVSARPFRVRFVDGTSSEELRESDFRSSGLDEQSGRAFEARQRQQRRSAVRAACEQLPIVTREALRAMRVRVTQDRLPLLKLLQLEPLQMQSSHLSFQEYYTACALCLGRRLPASAAAPWRWDAWWRNTLLLGMEMGEAFGRGLLMAVGESAELLDLNSKIAGDRPTSLLAISQLLLGCASVALAHNTLVPHEALPLAEGLRASTSLLKLNLASNHLCGVWFDNGRFEGEYSPMGIGALADALVANSSLTTLDLSQNCLGVSYINGVRAASIEGISLVAQAASASRSLRELNVSYNGIGPQGGKAIGDAFGGSATLTALDIGGNIIGLKGGKAVAEALRTNAAFVFVDVRFNSLDEATKALLVEVADERAAGSGIERKAAVKVLLD
eukprot:jgi/Chrpa1/17925/Chrysochromulina_OHIO_Genome00007350-RA